jgi:hypothetical protein
MLTVRDVMTTTVAPIEVRPPVADDRRSLAELGEWPRAAARLLADLGFTLVDGDRPGRLGSHLLVALRPWPTGRHFDPESIRFYGPADGRGRLVEIDRHAAVSSPSRKVLWGHVHVVDRFGIENRFLTFGGTLRSARDGDTALVDLWSPGPIVRWGGHSQGTDDITGQIGAFFGRLIVPFDFTTGAEGLLDGLPPTILYAAFLTDLARRLASRRARGAEGERLEAWVAAERRRLGQDAIMWATAHVLLQELGFTR